MGQYVTERVMKEVHGRTRHALLIFLLAFCLIVAGCANGANDSDNGETKQTVADDGDAINEAQEGEASDETAEERTDGDAAMDSGEPTSIEVSFEYEEQSGHASNQFAVWIEDAVGGYVTTLYATEFTASGGWELRPTSIPDWARASGITQDADVDAVSGATPSAGAQGYTWDFTDADGAPYGGDSFTVVVEGTLRWDNQILYRCRMDRGTGEVLDEGTEFLLRASGDGEQLAKDAPETSMLTNFKVTPDYDEA
jgi:hypothetical protein